MPKGGKKGGGGSGGPTHDVPLVAGGASTPVTPANRVEFAHRAARFYMGRCGAATAALAEEAAAEMVAAEDGVDAPPDPGSGYESGE